MKFKYHIIITKNNKQVDFIGCFTTETKALTKFKKLQNEMSNVKIPMLYINEGRQIKEVSYEIVLIKHIDNTESPITLLRNQYGEFIEHETNNKNWIVCEKAPYYKEETFWVYGYHPLVQRKDFNFIYDSLIKPNGCKKETFLSIYIYKNKLLIETSFNMDMVICKNHSDSIRLYNTIKEESEKDKMKYILFNGDWSIGRDRQHICIDKIQQLTNWNKLKITRSTTRP